MRSSVRTNVDELELPGWLRAAVLGGSREDVLQQGFSVGTAWWEQRLGKHGLAADLFPSGDGGLDRQAIFDVGTYASESPEAARRLLWAACAWGTGDSQRGNGRRVRGMARDRDRLGQLLADAAAKARHDPAAYVSLHAGQNRIYGLGPAFGTKFLYFAGAGAADHPCLILDARVARRLRHRCGWTSLMGTTGWPPDTYVRYVRLLGRWAEDLSSADRVVAPDEIEFRLFSPPEESAQ
jgi:hypothetical protein